MYSLSILFNLVVFFLVSLVLSSFGTKILSYFRKLKISLLSRFIFSFALGYGIFGYFLYLIGLAHLFYFWLIWLFLILVALFSFKEIITWLKTTYNFFKGIDFYLIKKNKFFFVILIFFLIWLFLIFVGTTSPMIEFDSRWYHFAEPKYYLEHHSVAIKAIWTGNKFPPSIFCTSGFPRLAEMFFSIFLSFKAEIAAKLTNLFFGLLGVFAIFLFTKKKVGLWGGLVAAATVLFSGTFLINATYGYIDLITFGLACLVFLSFFLYLENQSIKFLILSGVLTGLTISTKHNGLFLVPIFVFLILIWDLTDGKGWRRALRDIFIYTAFSLVFCFAWYVDTKIHTGLFFYPFASDTARDIRAQTQNLISREAILFFENFIINLPIFVFIFFAFNKKNLKIKIFLLISSLFFFILWGLIPATELRYLLPGLFGLAVLSGIGFENLKNYNRFLYFISATFLILVLLINILSGFLKIKAYFPYFLGQKSRHQFLTEKIAGDWWSIYDYNGGIKRTLDGAKGLVIGAWHTYYIDFPYEHASLADINFRQISSMPDLVQVIKSAGFDYIVAKRGDLKSQLLPFTSIVVEGREVQLNQEIEQYFPIVFEDSAEEIIIYRID